MPTRHTDVVGASRRAVDSMISRAQATAARDLRSVDRAEDLAAKADAKEERLRAAAVEKERSIKDIGARFNVDEE